MAANKIDAWWFADGDRLPNDDGRKIIIGEAHAVEGKIILCRNGLHASRDPFDALNYATGPYLHRVRCWGDVVEDKDKLAARQREYIAMRDATDMLRRYARERALSVIHLWDAPVVVRQYLETGDESLRYAAYASASAGTAAAWDAAWAAACAAAWDARDAAWAAAWATRAAARAARAAWAAAWATRKRFNEMVDELFKDAV